MQATYVLKGVVELHILDLVRVVAVQKVHEMPRLFQRPSMQEPS